MVDLRLLKSAGLIHGLEIGWEGFPERTRGLPGLSCSVVAACVMAMPSEGFNSDFWYVSCNKLIVHGSRKRSLCWSYCSF
jgi:hypothetical protein